VRNLTFNLLFRYGPAQLALFAGAGFNPAPGDYGYVCAPTYSALFCSCEPIALLHTPLDLHSRAQVVVTQHVVCGTSVWALHGHLNAESVAASPKGKHISAGEIVGWLGCKEENGGWHPHVHFQLSLLEPETHDMPGVVSTVQHANALRTFPDPRLVLGQLYEGDGLFEASDYAKTAQTHSKGRL
jgi:hypothetical protein